MGPPPAGGPAPAGVRRLRRRLVPDPPPAQAPVAGL